ncbi:MAG: cysteine methyltransferase [Planctomycetota bacterium]|nr:MAG: cysteine methyltransferase [Planctomycetota bacterium]
MAKRAKQESPGRNAAFDRIYAMVDSIPRGSVATYGQVAREAGLPGRARQAGSALRNLPVGSALPWHRVIDARGAIRTPGGRQRKLLEREGVRLQANGRVDLAQYGWRPEW